MFQLLEFRMALWGMVGKGVRKSHKKNHRSEKMLDIHRAMKVVTLVSFQYDFCVANGRMRVNIYTVPSNICINPHFNISTF